MKENPSLYAEKRKQRMEMQQGRALMLQQIASELQKAGERGGMTGANSNSMNEQHSMNNEQINDSIIEAETLHDSEENSIIMSQCNNP